GMTTELGAKQLTYTEGVFGKAAVFNGKDTYLYVKDSILNLGNSWDDNNDNFTISAWVNLGDSQDDEKYLLDKGKSIGWDKNDDRYWTDPYQVKFDNCEPIINLSNDFEDISRDPAYITEGSSSTRGKYVEGEEWFLLTVTYDGKRVKIYHDNQLLTQSNYTDGITFNSDELYIGVDGKLDKFFKGAVDDLRIYTKTLSYDEVNELYDKGLAENKELVEPTKQLVAYYAFDNNLKDASEFKNEAEKVAVGGTTKYTIGKNGKAITMSKGNYILVPGGDQLNLETQFTVSFWLKINTDGEYPILYRQNPSYTDDNDNDWTYRTYIDTWGKGEGTSVRMNTRVYDPGEWVPAEGQGLQFDFSYDDIKIKSNNWVHYTYTYQEGQMKFYLNGTLQSKSDKSDLINIANASGDLLIGYDGNNFINGAIDELKIYSKCLSATDVEKEAKRIDSISLSSTDAKNIASISKGEIVGINSVLLKDGDTGKISGIKTTDANVTYNTSNKNIFTVTKGKITARKAGKAKLTITYGCHSVTYTVIVK
ncbi:MAG: LamG domain-containing protein, partial [Herbinix sp.]|nr:LamG domain-containing protein [Herbinix sp.]